MFYRIIVVSILLISVYITPTKCSIDNNYVIDKLNWNCANNATCLNSVATNVLSSLNRKEPVNFGIFSIEPVPEKPNFGRSSKILDFLNGNAVRVPIGPMVFSVQRSDEHDNYIEVALLKKVLGEGRNQKGIRGSHRDKKHLQILIPMFLAANAIGWILLAIKAVGVLTVKALLVSKLALLVAAGVIVKKLMETASEKMLLARYPEHHEQPYIMPYNMEYTIPAHTIHGGEVSASEMYAYHLANPHEMTHSAMGQMGAESTLSHTVEMQNATQPHLITQMAVGVPKVKREDTAWTGIRKKPTIYNVLAPKNPVYVYKKV